MRRGERIGLHAKFPPRINSAVIWLLFPCYSADIPLFVPLFNSAKPRGQFVEIPESANVFETILARDGRISPFSPITGESGFPTDPESVHGPPRAGCRERGMLEKHAYTRGRMRRASGAVDLIQLYSGVA